MYLYFIFLHYFVHFPRLQVCVNKSLSLMILLVSISVSRPLSRRRSPNSPPQICPPKSRRKNYGAPNWPPNFASRKSALNTSRRRFFGIFIAFHHYALLIFMYVRLQTCIVWFLSRFSEGLMCVRQNFKLFCCAAYILNLIVSICLSCWPNL